MGEKTQRGFFSIGIYHPKSEVNIGTLWRSAYLMGASYIFTIGKRYKLQSSDTMNTQGLMPLFHYESFEEYKKHLPSGCISVAVETGGKPLRSFHHPRICSYILGAEDSGIPKEILSKCYTSVTLESNHPISYNVAVAGSILMYQRKLFFPEENFKVFTSETYQEGVRNREENP